MAEVYIKRICRKKKVINLGETNGKNTREIQKRKLNIINVGFFQHI